MLWQSFLLNDPHKNETEVVKWFCHCLTLNGSTHINLTTKGLLSTKLGEKHTEGLSDFSSLLSLPVASHVYLWLKSPSVVSLPVIILKCWCNWASVISPPPYKLNSYLFSPRIWLAPSCDQNPNWPSVEGYQPPFATVVFLVCHCNPLSRADVDLHLTVEVWHVLDSASVAFVGLSHFPQSVPSPFCFSEIKKNWSLPEFAI